MNCPNYQNCQLIHNEGFLESQQTIERYTIEYCTSSQESWHNCKRFKTWLTLSFCPNFVLPDTQLTVLEIIDRFDEELTQPNPITKDYGTN